MALSPAVLALIKKASLYGVLCVPVATVTHVNADRINRAKTSVVSHFRAKPVQHARPRHFVDRRIPGRAVIAQEAICAPGTIVPYGFILPGTPGGQGGSGTGGPPSTYTTPGYGGGGYLVPGLPGGSFPGGGLPGGGNPPPDVENPPGNPPSVVPELSTWVMMITGFTLVGLMRRRQRRMIPA